MATQVWLRNPRAYIREIVEVRQPYIAWDKGVLVKHSIDPVKFCDLHIPADMYYRMLIIGNTLQGAAELKRGGDPDKPDAVYPVWSADEEDLATLEELIQYPVGEDPSACSDDSVDRAYRPVLGQEHRIILTDLPNLNTGPGRRMVRLLSELQEEYPECIMHLHGVYSYRAMFGGGFRSVDLDGRARAAKGDIELPNGKYVRHEAAPQFAQWVMMLGFLPVDLTVPRNRCMYNIKSAVWAGKHWNDNIKFKSKGEQPAVDPAIPSSDVVLPTTQSHKRSPYQEGDKFICDTCSLQGECKYYREGAVCSVPESESVKLASFFNTRDSERIIEGLGVLLGAQANRLERGLDDEEYGEGLDPEVSKLINSLFSNGTKLAKLVNPALQGGPKVGVFVNGAPGSTVAVGTSANQLTAAIVQELEAKGIPRENITPEMVARVLDPGARTQLAIDARSVAEGSG
jgi:hypothetical protein